MWKQIQILHGYIDYLVGDQLPSITAWSLPHVIIFPSDAKPVLQLSSIPNCFGELMSSAWSLAGKAQHGQLHCCCQLTSREDSSIDETSKKVYTYLLFLKCTCLHILLTDFTDCMIPVELDILLFMPHCCCFLNIRYKLFSDITVPKQSDAVNSRCMDWF